jgi:hypothetical protein
LAGEGHVTRIGGQAGTQVTDFVSGRIKGGGANFFQHNIAILRKVRFSPANSRCTDEKKARQTPGQNNL